MDSELLFAVVTMTDNEFAAYLRSHRMSDSERAEFKRHMHETYGVPLQRAQCDHLTPEETLEAHSAHHGFGECSH